MDSSFFFSFFLMSASHRSPAFLPVDIPGDYLVIHRWLLSLLGCSWPPTGVNLYRLPTDFTEDLSDRDSDSGKDLFSSSPTPPPPVP